jgi:hypothetical protein
VKKIEAARIRDQEEMKKHQAELNAKLELLLVRVEWVRQIVAWAVRA